MPCEALIVLSHRTNDGTRKILREMKLSPGMTLTRGGEDYRHSTGHVAADSVITPTGVTKGALGKDLQSRTFDVLKEKLGVFYRRELVHISTHNKSGNIDLIQLGHDIESVTGKIVATENFRAALHQTGKAPFYQHWGRFFKEAKLVNFSNRLFKVGFDSVQDQRKYLQPRPGSY